MKIGIVTTWFERGAAYVSKIYKELLEKKGHEIFIYARGGIYEKNNPDWNDCTVTWGLELPFTYINKKHFFEWIKKNQLDIVFFNEQHEFSIVAKTKLSFPKIKLGSYIDYYTEETVALFDIYDFLICNTKRHASAFKKHSQVYYIKWGTDIELFKPQNITPHERLTFFHSMGMSYRKGTNILIEAFIKGKIYLNADLIIHTQMKVENVTSLTANELEKYHIKIISKTVTAPGLYHLGDVYVYPTVLEGLGLTIYEALACGLPVIITDFPPMNEVVENSVGRLVEVEEIHARGDGYYWPQAYCSQKSLIEALNYYLVMNKEEIKKKRIQAREYAESNFCLWNRADEISDIFEKSICKPVNKQVYNKIIQIEKQEKRMQLFKSISSGRKLMSFIWRNTK